MPESRVTSDSEYTVKPRRINPSQLWALIHQAPITLEVPSEVTLGLGICGMLVVYFGLLFLG